MFRDLKHSLPPISLLLNSSVIGYRSTELWALRWYIVVILLPLNWKGEKLQSDESCLCRKIASFFPRPTLILTDAILLLCPFFSCVSLKSNATFFYTPSPQTPLSHLQYSVLYRSNWPYQLLKCFTVAQPLRHAGCHIPTELRLSGRTSPTSQIVQPQLVWQMEEGNKRFSPEDQTVEATIGKGLIKF